MIPQDLKYTKEHEWLKVEGNVGVVGITAHAAEQLGEITFVEIPDVGMEVSAGDVLTTVESVKSVSEVFAPVSGKVVEVNEKLSDAPETVNNDPYGEGWICKLEMSNPAETESLLDASAYQALIEEEG